MKSGNLNFLEPSGPLQACNGTPLPLPLYDSENVNTTVHATPNTDVNYFQTTTSDTYHTISAMNDAPDERVITPNEFNSKISEYKDLNENQRDQLLTVLVKYQPHLTRRQGKCNRFEYQSNIEGKLPKSASSRTI